MDEQAKQEIVDLIAATIRRTLQEVNRKNKVQTLSDVWANEEEVLAVCGKSRWTLIKAIKDGRINPNDIRPNPIGTGYLFRRTAIIKP